MNKILKKSKIVGRGAGGMHPFVSVRGAGLEVPVSAPLTLTRCLVGAAAGFYGEWEEKRWVEKCVLCR